MLARPHITTKHDATEAHALHQLLMRACCRAGKRTDMMLDSKWGTSRRERTFRDSEVYDWADFARYGWTRTGDDSWFWKSPPSS